MNYGEAKAPSLLAKVGGGRLDDGRGQHQQQQPQQQQQVVSVVSDNEAFLDDLADLLGADSRSNSSSEASSTKEDRKPSAIYEAAANRSLSSSGRPFSISPSLLSQLRLPKETCATLFLEAINGFMFLVDGEGRCQAVSDHVDGFLGEGAQKSMEGVTVYRFMHQGDHARFSATLMQGKDGTMMRPGGPDSFLKSRVFTCRFQRVPEEAGYETLQVSAVGVQPPSEPVDGKDLSQCRLFCVARKVSLGERSQYFPVEMFSTKLDPNRGFRVMVVDTTGMNTVHASNIAQVMLTREILGLCHPSDAETLHQHLQTCVREGSDVSAVYRLQVFDRAGEFVHVRTKSKLFRSSPGNLEDFVMSTHSIIGESELRQSDKPDHRGGGTSSFDPVNNNLVKTPSAPDGSKAALTTDTLEKNLLLKQLLNVNFSRDEGSVDSDSSRYSSRTKSPSPEVSNSRILQLLSQSTENVPPEVFSPPGAGAAAAAAGVKRAASFPLDAGEPSAKSSVCKQNPALANLLAKPPHISVAVPPPVPTKWHQEPREKLPRGEDGLRKFLPPHPADRAAAMTEHPYTASNAAILQPRTTLSSRGGLGLSRVSSSDNSLPQNLLSDLLEPTVECDAMLSEILEGVIDIQEKSPSSHGGRGGLLAPAAVAASAQSAEIEHIEKFLSSCSESGDFQSGHHHPPFSRSMSAVNYVQTMAGIPSASAVPVASNNNRNANPVSLVPRMSELLQVVPPNVTIPECPNLESLVMLQQRRRSISGGGGVYGQQQQQNLMSQQRQRVPSQPSTANNLLMQQLNSAPLNRQQPHMSSYMDGYNGSGGSFGGSPSMVGGSGSSRTQMPTNRLQFSSVASGGVVGGNPMMQQQHMAMQMMQQRPMMQQPGAYMGPKRPPPPGASQLPAGRGVGGVGDSDECRSLLQQLLSE